MPAAINQAAAIRPFRRRQLVIVPARVARLPSIDKLTLILHGTADRMIPKESVQLLKGRLPRSYLVYVWDAAHAIEVDQPERMLSLVESFLQRSEGFMVNWGTLALDAG